MSRKSFHVRHDRMTFGDHRVHIEKIGKVLYHTNYDIPKQEKYTNPTCSYDGKYWYISFGIEYDENQAIEHTDESIGIDLGVKHLATLSNQDKPIKNINKIKRVISLKKKLKRKQRQVSRKYLMNKENDNFIKTQNITKLEKEIRLIHRKLTNIRDNHIHQTTSMIVNQMPKRVVMEDLNIQGMMKNKHLSEAIQEQKLYEFIRQMKYKCEWNDIEFIRADRWYPSSKKCSSCGHIHKELRLSDRTYHCQVCGLVIDRDKNAAINLSKYQKLA